MKLTKGQRAMVAFLSEERILAIYKGDRWWCKYRQGEVGTLHPATRFLNERICNALEWRGLLVRMAGSETEYELRSEERHAVDPSTTGNGQAAE